MTHVTTIREGVIGPGSPGERVFESNYVVECSCGERMNCATHDRRFAEQVAEEHVRRSAFREER